MVVDRDEARLLGRRNPLAHSFEDHRPHQGWRAGKHWNLVVRDASVRVEFGGQAFVPRRAIVSTLMGKAEYKDKELGTAWFWQHDLRIVQCLCVDWRNRLAASAKGTCQNDDRQTEECQD